MSCLALALQPANGPDILLQTREWFPPSRALVALSAFRQTRRDGDSSLGDDPLAASSGQVIVGLESRYRVVYRLVNAIFVLGITTVDQRDCVSNVFECIEIVNQAVSVLVAACRGVDVTPEKLSKKYAEVYMALDIVLRGVGSIRLAAMLASMHGDGIAKMVHSSIDTENKIRGADNWSSIEVFSLERQAGIDSFSNAQFEMPSEAVSAGDEFASTIDQIEQDMQDKEDESSTEKDPFAASDAINKPQELVEGFKKTKEPSATDLTLALAGLEVTSLPPAEATQSTFIGVEGFEGEYGGIEFSNDESSLTETFEGFHDAFGGGLDASEFVGAKKVVSLATSQGLGGLELLQSGPAPISTAPTTGGNAPLEDILVKKDEMKGPQMYIHEEISVEFRESLLARVGLKGAVYLRTLPVKSSGSNETEFSFRVNDTRVVKRFIMQNSRVSSLGDGMFHVKTASSDDPIPVFMYSLLPRLTPIPLRVRVVTRRSGTLLSVMIQYISNPDLPSPLMDVMFMVKLPLDPSLLKVSPTAILDRGERELRWVVSEIPLNGSPGRLRAQMAMETSGENNEEMDVVAHVKFSGEGTRSLSGISIAGVSEGKTDFYVTNHKFESGVYMCN